ncbi:MAG: FlgD immunoglobulin-like domain containing protein [Candidatus Coatesbacteria bacterium]
MAIVQAPAFGSPLKPGASIRYMIVVENTGDVPITDLTLTDTVAAEVVQQVPAQDDAQFTLAVTQLSAGGTRYVWSNSTPGALTLAPGQSFTFTLTGLSATLCDLFTCVNAAVAEGASTGTPTPTVTSNSVAATFYNPPDLTIVTRVSQVSSTLFSTIILANVGTVAVDDMSIMIPPMLHMSIPPGGAPSGAVWAAVVPMTVTANGMVSVGGPGILLEPGQSVTVLTDMALSPDPGGCLGSPPPGPWSGYAYLVARNPCSGSYRGYMPPPGSLIHPTDSWDTAGTMTVTIADANGHIVRRLGPVTIRCEPGEMQFSYTAAGTCGTWTSDPSAPFSPDGDCHNDILKVVFPGFLPNNQPFDGLWWDGRDDSGHFVPNGTYTLAEEPAGLAIWRVEPARRSVEVAMGAAYDVARWRVPYGKLVIAPNSIDRTAAGPPIQFGMRGKAGGSVDVRIWNEAGEPVRSFQVTLDGQGAGVVTFDGRNGAGKALGPGLYWVTAKGSGVADRKGFMVAGRRRQ